MIFLTIILFLFLCLLISGISLISQIYYSENKHYRVALYGDGKYYIECRFSLFEWTRYHNSYTKDEALKELNKLTQKEHEEKRHKKRIAVIKNNQYPIDKYKLSELVKAVNEGRKEDEERIFTEIMQYFN